MSQTLDLANNLVHSVTRISNNDASKSFQSQTILVDNAKMRNQKLKIKVDVQNQEEPNEYNDMRLD